MYFIGLIWSFLGVAIVADIFMCAIEGKNFSLFCIPYAEYVLYVILCAWKKNVRKWLEPFPILIHLK